MKLWHQSEYKTHKCYPKTSQQVKTKIILIAGMFALSMSAQAQNMEPDANRLRRAILKSDVILAGYEKSTINYINDYTQEEALSIVQLDSIILNTSGFKPDAKMKVPQAFDNYPLFWGDDGIYGVSIVSVKDVDFRYSNLLFFRKDGKQYQLIGRIGTLKWNDILRYYIPTIHELKEIDKLKDLNVRYSRTIDWYIANNDYPDSYVMGFYEQKGVIGDTLRLTEKQLQLAKEKFLKGNEKLLPFIEDTFKPEIKAYYLNKLKKIRRKNEFTYGDCFEFKQVIALYYEFDYKSMESITKNLLTGDRIDEYDKKRIMDYFIEMLENDTIK